MKTVLSNFAKTCRKNTIHLTTTIVFFIWIVVLLVWLLFTPPSYTNENVPAYKGPCPSVFGVYQSRNSHLYGDITAGSGEKDLDDDKQVIVPVKKVDCVKLIAGDAVEVNYTTKFNWCERPMEWRETKYLKESENCEQFKKFYGYNDRHVSSEEKDFPIAFSILTYESIEQTERLLRAIYRPHNVYCIHVDGKAPSSIFDAFTQISKCLPNVIVPTNPVIVHWAEFSVLWAEILCLRRLWEHSTKWKYFINLTGREFPLKTNLELVQILKAYNGANDIDGNRFNRNRDWTDYVWRSENWRTNVHKSPVPHGFNIHKGSAHIVASRAFIDYVLHSKKASDLLQWMRDTRLPDEHFFNTLNHNPQFEIPGAFTGDPGLKPFYGRLKLWWKNEKTSKCSGEWSRYICQIGAKELQEVTEARHLFVNKIKQELTPVAYQCLEQWYWNRTADESPTVDKGAKERNYKLDLKFYKELKMVSNHVKL